MNTLNSVSKNSGAKHYLQDVRDYYVRKGLAAARKSQTK